DSDIPQSCNSRRRIVRMECTENQVSSQRCLYSDLGGLFVADFANQDDVGSLAEHGTDNASKVEPDVMPHLNLIDPGQVVLHWVFGRDDLSVRSIQLIERRVQ